MTMAWWEEVKSAGAVPFCGPTGIYTIVVLMSWWCSLLKGRPNGELSDCLHTLDDIDSSILSAIRMAKDQPSPVTTPNGLPPKTPAAAPSPQPRGSKRPILEEQLSRKRSRSARA